MMMMIIDRLHHRQSSVSYLRHHSRQPRPLIAGSKHCSGVITVIWCLRRCICPTSVVNDFRPGVAMASKKGQWTNGRLNVSMLAVERYCIVLHREKCCKNLNMKFVSKIFKLTWIVSSFASALVSAVKFSNSFARRQHTFDIAATRIEYSVVFCSLATRPFPPKCSHLICWW